MPVNHSFPHTRLRRLRQNGSIRNLVQENNLSVHDLIMPIFIVPGSGQIQPIDSMPGVSRLSIDQLLRELDTLVQLGIQAVALFPCIESDKKTPDAAQAYHPDGLVPKAVRAIKAQFTDLLVITDVALDPYTTHGHDGIVTSGGITVDNDASIKILVKQALAHLEAGADIIAPSDMMDGRIGAIRSACEAAGYTEAILLSYTAKYASNYYAPFRDALATRDGNKISKLAYQMDYANSAQALCEMQQDINEGADILMVKPASYYLDIVAKLASSCNLPIFAYQVSGEYAMHMAAVNNGWLDKDKIIIESLLSIKRAGASCIFTYFAADAARLLATTS